MNSEVIISKLRLRFKFDILKKYISEDLSIKVLDIGAGNSSASIFKINYPDSYYVGVDKISDYNQLDIDYSSMDKFIQMDLTQDDLDKKLPKEEKYDLIIMSHIIEHIPNAFEVIEKLTKHLSRNGIIYIEWPGEGSLRIKKGVLPTLNFYDDSTHVRIYTLIEICNVLRANNMIWLEGGCRKHYKEIIYMPFLMLNSIKKRGKITGSVFWDLTGFANYVVFKKTH